MLRRTTLVLLATLPLIVGVARAEAPLDWSAWRAMPVMDAGRVMPLDTFARSITTEICGRANPTLHVGDQPARKFTAAELLASWLLESARWEDTPFLAAGNESLRRDILELPVRDEHGNRLADVSPRQFESARRVDERLDELNRRQRQSRAEGKPLELSGVDRELAQLNEAYATYRFLTFDPREPAIRRSRFLDRLYDVVTTWREQLEPSLRPWRDSDSREPLGNAVDRVAASLQKLVELLHKDDFALAEAEPPASALADAAAELASYFAEVRDRAFKDHAADAERLEQTRSTINTLASRANRMARLASSLERSLCENGRSLRVAPALDPWALARDRDPAEDIQPWLNLQTLLFGSAEVLDGYPPNKVTEVREAFAAVRAAYVKREAPERAARFSEAMSAFAGHIRALAEAIEPARRALPIPNRDEELLAATAYPPPGATATEVRYNRLDPFCWSWAVTLASIVCFALGFGVARRPMFWLGVVVLLVAQAFTLYGLGLRAAITNMVPVTNMFETVLFVGATVALLGLWFGLLPIVWPGLGRAWSWTAWPKDGLASWRSPSVKMSSEDSVTVGLSSSGTLVIMLFRAALAVAVIYFLMIGHYNPTGDGPVLNLWPQTAAGGAAAWTSAVALWLVGVALLIWTLWFVPRAIPAVVIALVILPWALAKQGLVEAADKAMARRPFVIAGAAVALLAYLVAYFAPGPVFNRDVGLQMAAVLRNNFWLAIHVLVITASYGAGALAWGLGNLSLGYYAFGRYRDVAETSEPESVVHRRPPEACATLGKYMYKAIQIAVLLLAAGTITGAIWADYAWGRYWGWDKKEVWALVTLLVYLAVLHGRWAGWTGNFGLAVGSVLGATAIMIAWYGVNFLMPGGLHSYGAGAGGVVPVLSSMAANWLFVAFATARYRAESRV